ncbi:MAG: protein-L-isoaspartate O-methyltransferase, partial [Crenarchaeota archaeon]|nr:protein-L-isoaspartate O-methyltransferase [Thermoproteota archaeon]
MPRDNYFEERKRVVDYLVSLGYIKSDKVREALLRV